MKVNEGNEDTLVSDVFYVKTIYKSRTLLFAQNQKDAWSFFFTWDPFWFLIKLKKCFWNRWIFITKQQKRKPEGRMDEWTLITAQVLTWWHSWQHIYLPEHWIKVCSVELIRHSSRREFRTEQCDKFVKTHLTVTWWKRAEIQTCRSEAHAVDFTQQSPFWTRWRRKSERDAPSISSLWMMTSSSTSLGM